MTSPGPPNWVRPAKPPGSPSSRLIDCAFWPVNCTLMLATDGDRIEPSSLNTMPVTSPESTSPSSDGIDTARFHEPSTWRV